MRKRKRQAASTSDLSDAVEDTSRDSTAAPLVPHPPPKRSALLIFSVLLFVANFVFLLITALRG